MVTKVNSEKQIAELLDDTGQLKLRTPLNLFIGGQILDRGVTIANLIGFSMSTPEPVSARYGLATFPHVRIPTDRGSHRHAFLHRAGDLTMRCAACTRVMSRCAKVSPAIRSNPLSSSSRTRLERFGLAVRTRSWFQERRRSVRSNASPGWLPDGLQDADRAIVKAIDGLISQLRPSGISSRISDASGGSH